MLFGPERVLVVGRIELEHGDSHGIVTADMDRLCRMVASGQDRKWDELSRILQNDPEMRDANGRQRKLIVFSEHRRAGRCW